MEQQKTQGNFLISAALAFASTALAVTCNLQTCLILACAAFWAVLARKEWRALRSARESENQEKRRQLRQRLLGGRA